MARPVKVGLDYFSLDVNLDDNIELMEAECGLEGFAILIKLWQKIYSEGYFIKWESDNMMLFSKRINSEVNRVNSVVNICLRRNLFNEKLYDTYKILTSKAIQKRYLTACKQSKRQNIPFQKEYLLVNHELIEIITELIEFTPEETGINPCESTQRKGKERKEKGKEKKEKENSCSSELENKDIYKLYEECGLGLLNLTLTKMIDSDIEVFTKEWVADAMKESVRQGKYKYSYVEGILRNWETNGREKKHGGAGQNTETNEDELYDFSKYGG